MWYLLSVVIGAAIIAALIYWSQAERLRLWMISRRIRTKYGFRHFEIAPAGVLRKKYGLSAENRPIYRIDPANIPERLRDLIPMAEKWGIEDDLIRSDFEKNASNEEKDEFCKALKGRTQAVNTWLDTFGRGAELGDAAHFMYMLLALDEMGLWPDPPLKKG